MNLKWWLEPWSVESNVWLVITSFVVALACALPGVFLVLRRMALVGDAISHSVLPGIVIAFLFTGALDSPWLVFGAAASGLAAVLVIEGLHRAAGVKEDAATGISFTAFFALGVVLLKWFAGKVDLDPDCVLMGSLETAVHGARWEVGGFFVPRIAVNAGIAVLGMVALLGGGYRGWLITAFDPAHARTAGFRPGVANVILMAAVSLVVVVAFQAVGAILTVALLILPGATALLCAKRVPGVLLVAALHAAFSSVGGLYLATALNCNAAAAVVLAGAIGLGLAWLLGPRHGLLRFKKPIHVATVILLLAITAWHLWCSLFVGYVAILGKQSWMFGILIVILFPPIVLIRWAMRSRLTMADLVLVVLAVLPGLILSIQEITRPRSPNIPWLAPWLVVYLLAPILVARMRVPNDRSRHASFR